MRIHPKWGSIFVALVAACGSHDRPEEMTNTMASTMDGENTSVPASTESRSSDTVHPEVGSRAVAAKSFVQDVRDVLTKLKERAANMAQTTYVQEEGKTHLLVGMGVHHDHGPQKTVSISVGESGLTLDRFNAVNYWLECVRGGWYSSVRGETTDTDNQIFPDIQVEFARYQDRLYLSADYTRRSLEGEERTAPIARAPFGELEQTIERNLKTAFEGWSEFVENDVRYLRKKAISTSRVIDGVQYTFEGVAGRELDFRRTKILKSGQILEYDVVKADDLEEVRKFFLGGTCAARNVVPESEGPAPPGGLRAER